MALRSDQKTKPASESSAGNKGCIVEVGVARGMTSVFLLQHMRHLRDNRTYFCMDTFAGFVQKDVDYEVKFRHKKKLTFVALATTTKKYLNGILSNAGSIILQSFNLMRARSIGISCQT